MELEIGKVYENKIMLAFSMTVSLHVLNLVNYSDHTIVHGKEGDQNNPLSYIFLVVK